MRNVSPHRDCGSDFSVSNIYLNGHNTAKEVCPPWKKMVEVDGGSFSGKCAIEVFAFGYCCKSLLFETLVY